MKLSEGSPEAMDVSELLKFAAKLDMVETAEMTELRAQIVAALQDPAQEDRAHELYARYEGQLEGLLQTVTTSHGQIGEQLLKAAIFGAAGRVEYYDEFMYDAIVSAANSGLGEDIVESLRRLRGGN